MQKAMKARLARHAFFHLEEIDGRSGTALLPHHVLNLDSSIPEDEHVLAVVDNPDHADRFRLPDGPLIGHYADASRKNASIIPTAYLLLSRDVRARQTAFKHFLKLSGSISHSNPKRMSAVLEENEMSLGSEDVNAWVPSALAIFDMVQGDFFLNLSAFKQCLAVKYDAGLNEYFPKLITPPMNSLEWIEVPVPIPSRQRAEAEIIIRDSVAHAGHFGDACEYFYQRLGTVPFAPKFALSAIFEEWLSSGRESVAIWQQTWDWANKLQTPLPRYHAVQLFLHHSELIPEEEFNFFWNEVTEIIGNQEDKQSQWGEGWRLREELALHFVKYFEARRPERNSEPIARFAWWMSEQIASSFGNQAGLIRTVRTTALKNTLSHSNLAWQSLCPPMELSLLRSATVAGRAVWSLALVSQFGEKLTSLRFHQSKPDLRLLMENTVGQYLSSWHPSATATSDSLTYAFESGLDETAHQIALAMVNPLQAIGFAALIAEHEALKNNATLLQRLTSIAELEKPMQAVTAFALKTRAYGGNLAPQEVWPIISNDKWQREVFGKLDLSIVQMLFDSLNWFQARGAEDWRTTFPHLLAHAAQNAEQDEERRKMFFLLTILSCIAGDTVSAIERILKGAKRSLFAEDVRMWHEQFEKIEMICPAWSASRIRAAVASLVLN